MKLHWDSKTGWIILWEGEKAQTAKLVSDTKRNKSFLPLPSSTGHAQVLQMSPAFYFHLEHSLWEIMARKKVFVARIQESLKENRPWQGMAAGLGRVESPVLGCGSRCEQFTLSIFIRWVGFVLLWHVPKKLRAFSLGGWQQGLVDPTDLGMPRHQPGLGSLLQDEATPQFLSPRVWMTGRTLPTQCLSCLKKHGRRTKILISLEMDHLEPTLTYLKLQKKFFQWLTNGSIPER